MNYLEYGKSIIETIKSHGKEAYFVGGFVRDKVLNRETIDVDITTSATPEEVTSYFDIVKDTGGSYGSVTVVFKECKFEVTTYREDGTYKNNRFPEQVLFTKQLETDLVRRDFTMNALVMDEQENIKDYYGGLDDIEKKVIRTIGDPSTRFTEDALRMLRAFRFSAQLGFDIDLDSLEAIKNNKELIKNISIERVMIELNKIFKAPYTKKAIRFMVETSFHEELYGLKEGLEYLQNVDDEYSTLHGFMACFALNDIDDAWRFSNREMNLMLKVLNLHEVTKDSKYNTFILFSNGLEICLLANQLSVLLGYNSQEDEIRSIYNNLEVKDVCDLKFKGQDILQLTTLRKRSIIALVIDTLLEKVLIDGVPNDYETLKEIALNRVEELQKELEENNE